MIVYSFIHQSCLMQDSISWSVLDARDRLLTTWDSVLYTGVSKGGNCKFKQIRDSSSSLIHVEYFMYSLLIIRQSAGTKQPKTREYTLFGIY